MPRGVGRGVKGGGDEIGFCIFQIRACAKNDRHQHDGQKVCEASVTSMK